MLNINNKETSKEDSNIEELIANLISIKKKRYLSKKIRLERPPDFTDYLFRLDSTRFKQQFRML
jgi:predicted N-acetyltransferase YhbS